MNETIGIDISNDHLDAQRSTLKRWQGGPLEKCYFGAIPAIRSTSSLVSGLKFSIPP